MASKNMASAIIGISISLFVIAILFPLASAELAGIGATVVYYPNGTSAGTLTTLADPTILTLISVLLPIIGAITLVYGFIEYRRAG